MLQLQRFYPPRMSPFACWALGGLLPPLLKYYCCVARIDVSAGDLARLHELGAGRMILSANHPSRVEPLIVGEMGRRAGVAFYYVSARENFVGLLGRLLQSVGGYSIIRGAPDRSSISMTRKLLAEDGARVVLFPEGDVYHHNEKPLPFHSGVAQMGFWALCDLERAGKPLVLPVVPVAVRYRYVGDITASLDQRLLRLAKAVNAHIGGGYFSRIRAIGITIIESLERQYGSPSDGSIPDRIDRIKAAIVDRVAGAIGLRVEAGASLPDKVRIVFNGLYEFEAEHVEHRSAYDERLSEQRADLVRPLTIDLWRLYNCMAVTGTYVTEHPTYERLAELIGRMEELVFGYSSRHQPREAFVRIGEPIELGQRLEGYKRDKRAAVAKATSDLEDAIIGLLAETRTLCTPIPEAAWGVDGNET